MTDTNESARFAVFYGDTCAVLRDRKLSRDYPFRTEEAAIMGIAFRANNMRVGATDLISSPSEASVYGEPTGCVSYFA